MEEICRRTSSFDVLTLVGTKVKAAAGVPVRRRQVYMPALHRSRVVIEAGYRVGPLVTNSCGCSVVLGRRFSEAHIVRVAVPPPELHGRGLLVRVKNGSWDLACIALYYPPRPRDLAVMSGYQRT
eukprot:3961308-Pyramimonas_sp.AAC.1